MFVSIEFICLVIYLGGCFTCCFGLYVVIVLIASFIFIVSVCCYCIGCLVLLLLT